MKIACAFLVLSTFVVLSQQQNFRLPQLRHLLPQWFAPSHQSRVRDVYDYLYAKSLLKSMEAVQPIHGHATNAQIGIIAEWADAQSRTKNSGFDVESSLSDDNSQDLARVFFNYVTTVGETTTFNNPLLKTIYYISSTTATTTLVSTCIPAVSFDATSYTVVCRKRREVLEMLLDGESNPEIVKELISDPAMSPSEVLPVEPSAHIALPRALGDSGVIIPIEIASSKAEDYLIENGFFSEVERNREKRFFIASSTITSYVFVTTSSTKTLSNVGSKLSCLPSQFALC